MKNAETHVNRKGAVIVHLRRDQIRVFQCPDCGAESRQYCTNPDGTIRPTNHRARLEAAQDAVRKSEEAPDQPVTLATAKQMKFIRFLLQDAVNLGVPVPSIEAHLTIEAASEWIARVAADVKRQKAWRRHEPGSSPVVPTEDAPVVLSREVLASFIAGVGL
jgi:hypothetical protein